MGRGTAWQTLCFCWKQYTPGADPPLHPLFLTAPHASASDAAGNNGGGQAYEAPEVEDQTTTLASTVADTGPSSLAGNDQASGEMFYTPVWS